MTRANAERRVTHGPPGGVLPRAYGTSGMGPRPVGGRPRFLAPPRLRPRVGKWDDAAGIARGNFGRSACLGRRGTHLVHSVGPVNSLSADSVLYFPLINLPPTTWSAQAVLYWDRILVPVPEQAAETFEELHDEPIMRELLQSRLVERVRPTDHLGRLGRLEDEFLKSLRSAPDLDGRREQFERAVPFRLHEGKTTPALVEGGFNSDGPFGLHIDKATSGLLSGLEDLGLGAASEDDWGWWYIERRTGYEYMALLAAELGDAVGAVPATDKREFLQPFGAPGRAVQLEADILLAAALPVPESIDVKKVVRFKEKHHDDLRRFRERVEELAQLIAWAPPDMRPAQLRRAAEEVQQARDEVEARFLEGRLGGLVRHRLMAVPSLVIPVVSTVRDVLDLLRPARPGPSSALAYGAWVDRALG